MDIKTEIKEEDPFSEVISQTERDNFSQHVAIELNSDVTLCDKVYKIETKREIKEETLVSDLSPEKDYQLSAETVIQIKQCHNKYKMEINEEGVDSDFCSQNKRQFLFEDPVVTVNQCSKDCEMHTKFEIEEKLCGPERTSTESPCVNDVTKDLVDECFSSIGSIRLYRETSDTARKCTCEEFDLPEIFSVQKSVGSEQHGEQMLSKLSCLKCSNFDSNKKNDCFKSVLVKDNMEKHKCEICEKRFTSPSDLKKHKVIHENKNLYQCDVCGKSYGQLSHLKRHKIIHEIKKLFQCDICDKSYAQLSHLKRHKLTHEGIRPYKCDTCGNNFTRLLHLKRHELTHEGIKPYKCNTCGNCFSQLTHLKRHDLAHQGIKPHKCDTCGKCFTGLAQMKRHKLTHEGKKPHMCDICGKCLTRLTDLKMHILIHEGIKPHKCDICGKCFTGLRNLKRHKYIHEGIKPHKCDTCGKCFTVLPHLKRHKLTH